MTNRPSKASKNPRVAIIGAGLMGRWHADAARHVGGTISAVADSNPARAAELVRKYPKARVARDLEEVIASGLADVVHICTPAETHANLVQQAIDAGLHSLVEKPLAESAETTSKLIQLAESRKVLLCPVHQFLFQPGVLRLQAAIEKFGPLLHVDTVICSAGAEHGAQYADTVVADILPGPLSLLARFVSVPMRNADWHVEHPVKGELRASATIENVSVSMLISMQGRPTTNALRVIGRQGTGHADLFHGFAVLERGGTSRARKLTHPFFQGGATLYSATANLYTRAIRREAAYPGLRELIRRFYEAVSLGGPPPISAAEILEVAFVREHILGKF
jgi:predicted dehydrogenase